MIPTGLSSPDPAYDDSIDGRPDQTPGVKHTAENAALAIQFFN
jgi:hypothetical protein